jgi:hypothetical protein
MAPSELSPDLVLIYSGEVYNFAELRAELQARGHCFRTRSDTEVVLRSYLEWGPGCVSRFRCWMTMGCVTYLASGHSRHRARRSTAECANCCRAIFCEETLTTFSMDPGSEAYFQPTFDQPSRDA